MKTHKFSNKVGFYLSTLSIPPCSSLLISRARKGRISWFHGWTQKKVTLTFILPLSAISPFYVLLQETDDKKILKERGFGKTRIELKQTRDWRAKLSYRKRFGTLLKFSILRVQFYLLPSKRNETKQTKINNHNSDLRSYPKMGRCSNFLGNFLPI